MSDVNPGFLAVDNTDLRETIAAFSEKPEQQTYLDVLRGCLTGQLLLDSTGSDRPVIGADGSFSYPVGATLQFGGGTGPDGEPALFAYTSQEQVARMHPDDEDAVQSIVQPAAGVLSLVTSEKYGWLVLDAGGPTCAIAARDAEFALRGERNDAVKEALSLDDPLERQQAVIDALAENGPLILAVDSASVPESGVADGSPVQLRTSQAPDGTPVLLAFTSGVEVSARNVEDAFATRRVVDIIRETLDGPFSGLVINPNGPWVALGTAELADILGRIEKLG